MSGWRGRLLVALGALATACVDTAGESFADCRAVGALLPFTGAASAAGSGMERALIFAAEAVNTAGGVAGERLCVRSADTHSELKVGLRAARDLVEGEGGPAVSALFGPNHEDLVLRLVDLLRDERIIGISGSDTTPSLTIAVDGGMWFRTVPSTRTLGRALSEHIAGRGDARIRVLYEGNEYGSGWASVISSEFSLLGRTALPARSFQPGQRTYLEDLRGAFADQVDAVVLVAMPASGAAMVTEWADARIGGRFYLAPALRDQVFLDNIPPHALDGTEGLSPRLDPLLRARYAAAYAERWSDEEPMPASLFYYDALAAWALAVEYAGRGGRLPDGSALSTALGEISGPPGTLVGFDELGDGLALTRAGTDIDYQGLTGPIDFDASGDCASQGVELWRVEGDTFVVVD